jgi:hypothetical protein
MQMLLLFREYIRFNAVFPHTVDGLDVESWAFFYSGGNFSRSDFSVPEMPNR